MTTYEIVTDRIMPDQTEPVTELQIIGLYVAMGWTDIITLKGSRLYDDTGLIAVETG